MRKLVSLFIFFPLLTFVLIFGLEFDSRSYQNSQLQIRDDEVKLVTDDDQVSFFVIGDWGGLPVFPYRTIIEQSTSKEMTELAKLSNIEFQLALGDNFYFNGVVDSDDKRFKETYESVFNSEYLNNTPWFILLGNHDHYGNATAQLEYTHKSKRWILPSFNYTIDVKPKKSQDDLISIMMIDTVLMCGNSPYEGVGEPKFVSKEEEKLADDYFTDFEERLKLISQTNVPYILVAGHFPVWSIAEHGPTKCLVDKLRPLLHKYNVSAYFSGHDHNLQHIKDTYLGQAVDYIVSGCSNFIDESTQNLPAIPPNSLKFHWAAPSVVVNGGFNLINVNEYNMTITFYETTGKSLYQTVVFPRSF